MNISYRRKDISGNQQQEEDKYSMRQSESNQKVFERGITFWQEELMEVNSTRHKKEGQGLGQSRCTHFCIKSALQLQPTLLRKQSSEFHDRAFWTQIVYGLTPPHQFVCTLSLSHIQLSAISDSLRENMENLNQYMHCVLGIKKASCSGIGAIANVWWHFLPSDLWGIHPQRLTLKSVHSLWVTYLCCNSSQKGLGFLRFPVNHPIPSITPVI